MIKWGGIFIEIVELIYWDLVFNFKYVCVWGMDVYDGIIVKGDYVFSDCDIVEIYFWVILWF